MKMTRLTVAVISLTTATILLVLGETTYTHSFGHTRVAV